MTFLRQMVEGLQQPAMLKRRSQAGAGAPEVSLLASFAGTEIYGCVILL